MNKHNETDSEEAKKATWPRWTVTFAVAPLWVHDGFNLDEKIAKKMIEKALPLSYREETQVRIDKAPPQALLRGLRG